MTRLEKLKLIDQLDKAFILDLIESIEVEELLSQASTFFYENISFAYYELKGNINSDQFKELQEIKNKLRGGHGN